MTKSIPGIEKEVFEKTLKEIDYIDKKTKEIEKDLNFLVSVKKEVKAVQGKSEIDSVKVEKNSLIIVRGSKEISLSEYKATERAKRIEEIRNYKDRLVSIQENILTVSDSLLLILLWFTFIAFAISYISLAIYWSSLMMLAGGILLGILMRLSDINPFDAINYIRYSKNKSLKDVSKLRERIEKLEENLEFFDRYMNTLEEINLLLQKGEFRKLICSLLVSVSDDVSAIAQAIVSGLIGVGVITAVSIQSAPFLVATLSLMLARAGISTFCPQK